MTKIILDTCLIVAYLDTKDKWHAKAVAILESLGRSGSSLGYLDCVANEVLSVIGKRLEEKKKTEEFKQNVKKVKKLMTKRTLIWLYPTVRRLYDDIIALMETHRGKLNFHDALIALAAKEMEVKYIASFDEDFDGINWLVRMKDEADIDGIGEA